MAEQDMDAAQPLSCSAASADMISEVDLKGTLYLGPITEHLMTLDQVCERYHTVVNAQVPWHSQGLTAAQVVDYQLKHEKGNRLSPVAKPHIVAQYFKYFLNVFSILLCISGLLSYALYAIDTRDKTPLFLGSVMILMAFFNAGLLFYQEYKTASLLQSFMNLIPENAMVIREHLMHDVPASELVPGDLVHLKMGDKVPADLYLVHASDLKVDNSSLTGESEPQERVIGAHVPENPLEARNIAFNGSLVVSGEGQGIVIRIGDATMLGQIARLTISEKKRSGQLASEIDLFVKKLAAGAVVTAIVFMIIGFIRDYDVSMNFTFAIGVFISLVPEGLPVTVTALLTITAKRLALQNVLVKDLHSVETLGTITMLATDKTGTLTQNKMSVSGIWTRETFYLVPAQDPTSETRREFEALKAKDLVPGSTPGLESLVRMCILCSKCRIEPDELDKVVEDRVVLGDATETGLYQFAMEYENPLRLNADYPKIMEIPFNTTTKWHLTIHSILHTEGHYIIYVKGAPERIMSKCTKIRMQSTKATQEQPFLDEPWTAGTQATVEAAYAVFAANGQRVLAFAEYKLPKSDFPKGYKFDKDAQPPNFPIETGFTFVGLVSLMDPPKRGVRKAIAAFRTAGIQVVMVTGDHPLTAQAIARKIGLIQGETAPQVAARLNKSIELVKDDDYDAIIVHGDKIDTMTDAEWDHVLSKKEIVFARTSPKHKLLIVIKSQAKGHIVGVSGDGVNDSPALKKADLGISMNKTGSDVSKEAATMILLDDNFCSIVTGILQGRLLFSNLKKSIRYTLTHVMPEILSFLVYLLFGIPLPLSPFLLLFIDLVSELAPAFSYAYEPAESDLMLAPPRKVLCTPELSQGQYQSIMMASRPPRRTASLHNPHHGAAIGLDNACPDKSLHADLEAGSLLPSPPLSWLHRAYLGLAMKWRRLFGSHETGEGLVDKELLLWSYFQGGLIIVVGCFAAYLLVMDENSVPLSALYDSATTLFTEHAPPLLLTNGTMANAHQQIRILASAQSGYYAAVVIGQWFTLFMVKRRHGYPFDRNTFQNRRSIYAVLISATLAALVIYLPPLNEFIPSGPVGVFPLLIPLAAGLFMIMYEYIRRYLRSKGYFGRESTTSGINLMDLVRTSTTAV